MLVLNQEKEESDDDDDEDYETINESDKLVKVDHNLACFLI
jgi:hypothetical protein